VELIGAKLESINKAEDRELFANVSGRVGNELSVMSWLLGGAGGRPWLAGWLAGWLPLLGVRMLISTAQPRNPFLFPPLPAPHPSRPWRSWGWAWL
jgi:hypothetical protein